MNSTKLVNKNVDDQNYVVKYTQHEINNFQIGKVKIVNNESDIDKFIVSSIKHSSNAKLYFGKINNNAVNKMKIVLDVNIENYNISLQANTIRHILKNHGNSDFESSRGQVAIVKEDFKLLTRIILDYDSVQKSGITKYNNLTIIFQKEMGYNYYLVGYISDKKHNLEIKTMWKVKINKKNSATASDALMPRS